MTTPTDYTCWGHRELIERIEELEAKCSEDIPTNPEEVDDNECAELARMVGEGYTSGVIDSDTHRVAWKLTVNKFTH